jgi:hypothetical protein
MMQKSANPAGSKMSFKTFGVLLKNKELERLSQVASKDKDDLI